MGKVPKNSTSDIFVVEVNVVTSIHDWVMCSYLFKYGGTKE
jgi:hypothetical protein